MARVPFMWQEEERSDRLAVGKAVGVQRASSLGGAVAKLPEAGEGGAGAAECGASPGGAREGVVGAWGTQPCLTCLGSFSHRQLPRALGAPPLFATKSVTSALSSEGEDRRRGQSTT